MSKTPITKLDESILLVERKSHSGGTCPDPAFCDENTCEHGQRNQASS